MAVRIAVRNSDSDIVEDTVDTVVGIAVGMAAAGKYQGIDPMLVARTVADHRYWYYRIQADRPTMDLPLRMARNCYLEHQNHCRSC